MRLANRRTAFALIVGLSGFGIGVGGLKVYQHRRATVAAKKAVADAMFRQMDRGGTVVEPIVREHVRLEQPFRGSSVPKVNLVEFADFECPFSTEVEKSVRQLLAEKPDDVRLSFRTYPDIGSPDAVAAAEAAFAADEQGKFWEMHDILFQNRGKFEKTDLERYAREIGLDLAKFKATLATGRPRERVETEAALAGGLQVRGTPTFFLNGQRLPGAFSYKQLKAAVDEEIGRAERAIATGISRDQVYARLTEGGQRTPELTLGKTPKPDPALIHRAGVGSLPPKGPMDAAVTIVEFGRYDCEPCRKLEPTLAKVMEAHKGDVRLIWRDLAGAGAEDPKRDNDMIRAALAGRAAAAQEKFWPMHDALLDVNRLDAASLDQAAQKAGLDLVRFRRDLASVSRTQRLAIRDDFGDAVHLGVHEAPSLFVNGRFLEGNVTYEKLNALVEETMAFGRSLVSNGTAMKEDLYSTLMRGAVARTDRSVLQWEPEDDHNVFKVPVGDSPARGPKTAPITAVVFGDFQCSFTRRLSRLLTSLEAEYEGKVQVVWKSYPRPGDEVSALAARAGLAAAAQGKFWPMAEKMLATLAPLDRRSLERYAAALRLNLVRFRSGLDDKMNDSLLAADESLGESVGVEGTPTVFINGRRVPGLYAPEVYRTIIEQELTAKEIGKLANTQVLRR